MKTILNYADLVKEQHALNTTIAPVETDLTSASQAYAVGQKFIYDGVLYQAKTAIAQGAALVLNTNYEAADDVSSELEALTNKLNNEIVTRSELGAKNLLPYDIQKIKALNTAGTWNGNTYTPNNSSLNITLNTDGSITVDGTSASAATATLYIYGSASEANENIFKGMIASGCPSGGATNKYSLAIQGFSTTTPSGGNNYHDIGEGITVGNDNYVRVYVRIQNNTTVSNLTFKPMIRLASDPDATYQPYAKTNQELTAENQTLTNEIDGGWYKGRNLCSDSNVSGTATASVNLNNPLPAGTYTLSAVVTSSDTDADTCLIYDVSNSATLGYIARSIQNDRVAITFTTANAIAEIRFYASNSYNASQGDTFSFTDIQIEKGEIATKYVPYAMTNRELTEYNYDSYSVEKTIRYVEVETDGVKTISTLLDELCALFKAELADGNKTAVLYNLDVPTYALAIPASFKGWVDKNMGEQPFSSYSGSSSGITITTLYLKSSASIFRQTGVNSSGNFYNNDLGSAVIASGNKVRLRYQIAKMF